MASSRDAQDILDLKQSEGSARPKKKGPKPKLVRPAHIPKEVWLLETQGDRAPPVALTALQPKKPKFTRRVKPWEWQTFTHPNRMDGLVLRHWRKKRIAADVQADGPATPADATAPSATTTSAAQSETLPDQHWKKYNAKVDVPKYDQEQYDKSLKSDDWTKEETDYLMELVRDFDLRWILIADRYNYESPAAEETEGDESMAVVPVTKHRTMEDLKGRYYKVASAMMAVHHPLQSMTQIEFSLHEKMTKFDPTKEARRKRMAEQLLERTDAEIEEEKWLLAELKRIVQDEDDFIAERQELYERLAAPSSRGNMSMYESSAGLAQLGQQLAAQDRSRSRAYQIQQQQRRQIAGLDDKDKPSSPAVPPSAGLQRGADSRRSLEGPTSSRKDNKAGQHSYVHRQLTEREERRYGVQRPEKLLTGERIRHVRIERRVTARASSVAAKVQDSMVELGIPIKPVMATQRITEGYEQLCASLDLLLDSRRISEKVENEIKVLIAQKETRENKDGTSGSVDANDERREDGSIAKTEAEEDRSQAQAETSRLDESADEDEDQDDRERSENEQSAEEEEEEDEEATKEAVDQEELEEEEEEEEAQDEDEELDKDLDDTQADVDDEEDEDGADVEIVAKADSDEEAASDDDEGEERSGDETPTGDAEDSGGDDEVDDAEDESRPSTRTGGRKRSLSVLSSTPSQKSTKRQKK